MNAKEFGLDFDTLELFPNDLIFQIRLNKFEVIMAVDLWTELLVSTFWWKSVSGTDLSSCFKCVLSLVYKFHSLQLLLPSIIDDVCLANEHTCGWLLLNKLRMSQLRILVCMYVCMHVCMYVCNSFSDIPFST